MTIWTTFLCGGVGSAGLTVVAGTARVLGPLGRFPGADELEAFRTMAAECASDASVSVLSFGLSVVTGDDGCRVELVGLGWLARRAAMVLLLRRAFLAGSMRTAFSMQISWVYELKLVRISMVYLWGLERKREIYPWPSLMAFV